MKMTVCLTLLILLLTAGCAQTTTQGYLPPPEEQQVFGSITEEPDPATGSGDVDDNW